MKRKRYSEEQIISILKEHEAGMPAQEVIRKHGIANGTFYRGKEKFSGMEISDVKRLRELEAENAKLKRLLAKTLLDKTALEDVVQKKWCSRHSGALSSAICSKGIQCANVEPVDW